jgi:hypothetical protein
MARMDRRFAFTVPRHYGDFLAGFFDAEGHLGMQEHNGGTSVSCFAELRVRDDDAEILEWLAGWSGVGSLYAVPARATSRRQVGWKIRRRDECAELTRLLRVFPLRSRKARELRIWSDAVELWCSTHPRRRELLSEKMRELRWARAFVPPPVDITAPVTEDVPLAFLAAFLAGEGHFGISHGVARLTVRMRADDGPLLRRLAHATGLGRVYDAPNRTGKHPLSMWVVYRRAEVREIARRLCQVDIPGRKGREIYAWRVAVEGVTRRELRRGDPDEVRRAVAAHRAARAYPGPRQEPLPAFGRLDRRADAVAALQAWAAERTGTLSCCVYDRWRAGRLDAPNRNTIAERFGSWHAALEAAGLGDRAARAPRPRRRPRPDDERRRRVLAAVRRCADDLGRLPRVTDYSAWRLGVADAPAASAVYRLFRGWDEVVAAAG